MNLPMKALKTVHGKIQALVGLKVRFIAEAAAIYIRRSAQPQTQVFHAGPVADIVAAFPSRPGVIGNFVPVIAGLLQEGLCQMVHPALLIFTGQRRPGSQGIRKISNSDPLFFFVFFPAHLVFPFPGKVVISKRRPFLQDQTVGGNMLRLKHDDPPDGIPPGLGALARYGAHQVYINIGKPGHSGSLKTHQEILKSMDPSKELQFLIGS